MHLGKTRAWNSAGEEPPGLFEELPPEDPEHPCWTGNWAIPAAQQGVVVLGSPIGSREFIATQLAQRLEEQDRLLSRIPHVPNLQSAWLLLLYCAAPRSTYLLRTLSPADTADFAASHDAAIQHCLAQMLAGGDGDMPLPELSHRRAQLPLSMGGLGLGSAVQQRHAAYWSSWADTARAGRSGHPSPPAAGRDGQWNSPPAREQQNRLPASCAQKASLRQPGRKCWKWMPPPPPTTPLAQPQEKDRLAANGILKPCTSTRSRRFSLSLTPRLERCCCRKVAMRRAAPSRLSPPVPTPECRTMSSESCCSADSAYLPLAPKSCGGLLDVYGNHRSACAQVGVLARRAGPLERAAARICKEAGARVALHVALRDLNLDVPASDGCRIEVVANGLPLWQGAQVAVDATVVSPVRRAGQPRSRADQQPGLALAQAVDRKGRTYPELRQARRCRLVVFGVEVGGRISRTTLTFLRLLAKARARQRAPWCSAGVQRAMMHRWTALASFAALRAHACSLLELPIEGPGDPTDGLEVPLGELLAGHQPPAPSRLWSKQ